MDDIAAHLIERVLPPVPVRQWALSLPWHLRYALAGDPVLLRAVARAFLRAVDAPCRRRARQHFVERTESASAGANRPHTAEASPPRLTPGAVNFVQRFGSSLGLNIHFHALFIDGVHVDLGPSAPPKSLPPLELQPEEALRVNADAIRRIHRAVLLRSPSSPAQARYSPLGTLAPQAPQFAPAEGLIFTHRVVLISPPPPESSLLAFVPSQPTRLQTRISEQTSGGRTATQAAPLSRAPARIPHRSFPQRSPVGLFVGRDYAPTSRLDAKLGRPEVTIRASFLLATGTLRLKDADPSQGQHAP